MNFKVFITEYTHTSFASCITHGIKHVMNIKHSLTKCTANVTICCWPEPHFYCVRQLGSRNKMFIWKYRLRHWNFSTASTAMWFTVHGQHDSRSRVKTYTRSLSCRPSFLSQARENTPPVEADSWKPLFDFTVYGQWVRPVYEAVWLRNISGFTMCSVCLFSTHLKWHSLRVSLCDFFFFFTVILLKRGKNAGLPPGWCGCCLCDSLTNLFLTPAVSTQMWQRIQASRCHTSHFQESWSSTAAYNAKSFSWLMQSQRPQHFFKLIWKN